MTYYDELDNVMAAMRQRADGSSTESYQKLNRDGQKVTIGPYRIPVEEWDDLTADAGIMGAPWYDRVAQNAVVRHQLTRLYSQYGGRWDVAVAGWEAGEQVADRMAQGETIDQIVAGEGAARLNEFVTNVAPAADPEATTTDLSMQAITGSPFAAAGMRPSEAPPPVRKRPQSSDVISQVLTTMRDRQVARGGGANDVAQEGEPGVGSLGTPETP